LFNDMHFHLKYDTAKKIEVAKKLASVDWSLFNKDWFSLSTKAPIVDGSGRAKLVCSFARKQVGDLRNMLRAKTGISDAAKALNVTLPQK